MASTGAGGSGHAPRIGHKKSRNGCLRCRARRVKCDETHPECKNCNRLGLVCRFSGPSSVRYQRESSPGVGSSAHSPSSSAPSQPSKFFAEAAEQREGDLEESRPRRMMELRLLTFWLTKPGPRSGWWKVWMEDVPRLAIQHNHLLYALLSFAATQLSAQMPQDEELALARQVYWTMALREQRMALEKLDTVNQQVVALAGHLIAMNAFATLKHRSHKPYTAPMEWFDISRGAQAVQQSVEKIPEDSTLGDMQKVLAPILANEQQADDNGVGHEYQRILDPYLSPSELSTLKSIRPYEGALRYISTFRRAIVNGESNHVLMRRLILFPYVVGEFRELIREQRPRALVVLACFFALISQLNIGRYYGDPDNLIPQQEVTAINNILPDEWKPLMARPMDETFGSLKISPYPSPSG